MENLMKTFRFGALAVGAALVLANLASAQVQPRQPGGRLQIGAGPILTPEAIEQLKLSGEQKEKVEKITKDYTEATRANSEKQRELAQKIRDGGDAATEARTKLREIAQATQKARQDAVTAINAVLNDEQKKKFEELQQRRRPGIGVVPGGLGGLQPGQVLPARIQQQLDLTADQKEKIEKLQKDVEAQLKKILTEEQNKKLDELKQGGGGIRPRPIQPGNVLPRRPARP
jgi:Spy/CpxP family protein refolding chaperone